MEDVKAWLSSNGLGEYWQNFEEHGWDELSLLAKMSDEEIVACIKKAGHRAKFREAIKSLTYANAVSHSAESGCKRHAVERQRERTNTAVPSLPAFSETTAQLHENDRTESRFTGPFNTTSEVERIESRYTGPLNTASDADRTESTYTGLLNTTSEVDRTETTESRTIDSGVDSRKLIEMIQEQENANPGPKSAASEVDRTDVDEAVVDVVEESGIIDDSRKESGTIYKGVDSRKPIQTIQDQDDADTDVTTATGEVERTDIDKAAGGVVEESGYEDIRTEKHPNATKSLAIRNEVSQFGEMTLETSDRGPVTTQLSNVDQSYTVIDGTVLGDAGSQLMNRGSPHITIIERSESTTVNQGPTQLYVAPEFDETNNPVANMKGQMEMLADSYRSKDHLFVETKAFNELKIVVEEIHWATLLGKPGDGKSATAAHLLLQYTDRGYDPVFLSSPRDWKMLISDSPSSRQVVVIDDMFGQSYLNDNNNVGKWKSLIESMSRILKQRHGNLVVICTSRRYIFKDIETALSKHACFLKQAIVDMTEEHFKLTGDEKVAILTKFVEDNKIETTQLLLRDIRYVDPPHGFPHCVELYCTNSFLRNEGIAFFKNPVQYVEREICNFKDNDRVKFLVLLLVLHNGEKLGLDTLDRLTENTTDDDKKLFRTAGVSVETAIPDIHRALKGLANTYLKQNQDGSYSFSHYSLRETVAFIYISTNPSHAIQALEFHHIKAFIKNKEGSFKGTVSNLSLLFEPFAKRMKAELQKGYGLSVISCDVWNDETFVCTFLKFIENEFLVFQEKIFGSESISDSRVFIVNLLIGLINWKRYYAARAIIENKSIQKTLHVDFSQIDEDGISAIVQCPTQDSPSIVDINQTDKDGIPAVFQCLSNTRNNGWNRLLCMVNHGANIHTHCKYGNIVTFVAGRTELKSSSKLCILKQLSDFDVDFRCTGIDGSNAIHRLCSTKPDDGNLTLLEYLLDKGVNAKAANKDGVVPLMLALKNNFSIEIIQTLAKSSPSYHVDMSGQGYIHYLMSSWGIRDMDEFCDKCEILIKLDLFMNGNDNDDKSPNVNLMGQRRITQTGCDLVQRFQFLHENGIDLHAKDCHGRNIVLCVLDWELTENVLPVLQYFHSIGIDLKLSDNDGWNALHHLFANTVYIDKYIGHDMISDHMYDVTKREFPEAAGNMLKEIYDFLTDVIGLLPTIADKNGINAVMLALKNCAGFSWISDLLKFIDIPLQADNQGRNYFHYLAVSRAPDNTFETVKAMLLDKGLTVYIIQTLAKSSPSYHVDMSGQGYIHYLMSSLGIRDMDEFCDKCEILIKLDLFMNGNDNDDKSPNVNLMGQRRITQTGCDLVQRFQFLHENGIDLHAKDCHGRNIVLCVLDWELTENVLPVLQYFHSIGIDLKLSDNDGWNALHHLFANTVYIDKYIGHDMISDHMYDVTKREFPEAAGNMLKEIYDFLTDVIGLLPTIADKNGINAVMLALKNCAGFSWISDLLKFIDIPLQADNQGRDYFHYLAVSRAPDNTFETVKAMLLDKGLTVDSDVLMIRKYNRFNTPLNDKALENMLWSLF